MKPTQEILTSIDFDKYIDWIKDIYLGIDLTKFIKNQQDNIDRMAIQEYRINTYYSFKRHEYVNEGKITENQRLKTEGIIKNAIKNRERKARQIKSKKDNEKYLDYLIHFIPLDVWTETISSPEKLQTALELIEIDYHAIDILMDLLNIQYQQIIDEIKDKQDINPDFDKVKLSEIKDKDFEILEHIVNKTFYPLFGMTDGAGIKTPNILIMGEIAELKAIQSFIIDKPTKPGKVDDLVLPQQMLLLKELGFFDLPYFKKDENCTVKKRNEVTARLLNANLSNVKDNFLAFTSTSAKTGKNPMTNKHEALIKQILKKDN